MPRPTSTHELCPYTLKQLCTISETNREHIFHDALGGVDAYTVIVDKDVNSKLGHSLDVTLIESPLIAGLRVLHHIASRTGEPKWKFRGQLPGSPTRVEITIRPAGLEERILNPVQLSTDKKSGIITMPADQMEPFLQKFIQGHLRKGKDVILGKEMGLGTPNIPVDLTLDILAIKRVLIKIAYLGAYEYLGDAFLVDPLNEEWLKAIFAETREDAASVRLHGIACDPGTAIDMMLPSLAPYEHAFSIANVNQMGPVVAVSLFGKSFHSVLLLASETSNYGIKPFEGEIVIINARDQSMRRMPFEEHMRKYLPSIPLDWMTLSSGQ